MREIKFRAWNKGESKLVEDINEIWDSYYGMDLNQILLDLKEDYELMQYTGLRDKNGKEIYEGDIVEIYWSGGDETLNWFVEWDGKNACFCLRQRMGSPTYTQPYISANPTFINDLRQTVIVGNIYENPELVSKLTTK